MNTYELVDKLEKHNWYKLTTKDDVIDMLLQQADHINELDILLDKKYAVIKQQADRIAELEKAIFKESKYLQNVKKAVLANEQG